MGIPVKITVIGAGSATFSMGLVKDLCLTENLAGSHVTFMDIDEARLERIHRLAERYIGELGGKLTFDRTTDLTRSLQEADFVINTAGGEYGHMEDRKALAQKHGYYSGAAFGVNYYNLNLMLNVAREIEHVCPDAWLIQSGNPVYEGTTLMTRETDARIIGLCHGHYGYINVANVLGMDPEKVTWVAPGLNHTIWLTEVRYEGYGPGGVAIIIEALTDNRNRTVSEIRHVFSKNGGNLGEQGSVSWMFERKSHIVIALEKATEDQLMNVALEAGADDLRNDGAHWEVLSAPPAHESVLEAIHKAGIETVSAQIGMVPKNLVKLEGKNAAGMLRLSEALDDHDDVQNIYSNFDIDEKEMEALA